MPPRRWEELTSPDIAALLPETVAILPVSATEQHGPHLPLNTDAVINAGILDRALSQLPDSVPALALPPWVYGFSPEHLSFPGTMTLPAEALLAGWRAVAEGVHRAGLRRLVLFNSHGGNPPVMELLAFELRQRLGMLVVPVSWGRFGLPDRLFPEDELKWGIHGGAVETSLMLHLRPDLVRADKLADFRSAAAGLRTKALRLHDIGWAAQDLNPAGVVGDTTLATAGKGAAVLEHAARGLATLLEEVAAHPWP
ncbi:creatininase family protein [Aerophototrophica crusticola]|uniref:Creatininase family protein n=1 Tax=Aerophototrophica crusticola TaxID=1709002 RepID=A0A858R6B3_9PROT|nr:creatininase family protein [Rhodospirillaceae bacterium B3]